MTLTTYIHQFPFHERSVVRQRLAQALGISEVYVRSMCNGHKPIPGKYALAIERFTQGAVPRHITAPHLYPLE
jgi:DNA-binding transcriptional regulator YdaS (Cro superfamily)